MMKELVAAYEGGSITGYQLMMQSLHMIDPGNPSFVLCHLPPEVLEEMRQYACRYDPHRMRTPRGELPPAADQVQSALHWIEERVLSSPLEG